MVTISQNHTYPFPCIDDVFASLAGSTTFSKVDLAHGYQQFPLDDTPNSTLLSTHTKASNATIVCPFMCPHHALSSNEQWIYPKSVSSHRKDWGWAREEPGICAISFRRSCKVFIWRETNVHLCHFRWSIWDTKFRQKVYNPQMRRLMPSKMPLLHETSPNFSYSWDSSNVPTQSISWSCSFL